MTRKLLLGKNLLAWCRKHRISRDCVYYLMNNVEAQPRTGTALQLAKALEVDVAWLIDPDTDFPARPAKPASQQEPLTKEAFHSGR